jgi:hypothetical protein
MDRRPELQQEQQPKRRRRADYPREQNCWHSRDKPPSPNIEAEPLDEPMQFEEMQLPPAQLQPVTTWPPAPVACPPCFAHRFCRPDEGFCRASGSQSDAMQE